MMSLSCPFLKTSRKIAASREAVWDVLTDTTKWTKWGPSITAVECTERRIQLGSTGRVRTILGLWLSFTITAYEEGEYWSWRVTRFGATGHRLTELGAGKCLLTFEVPLLAAPYVTVCNAAMKRIATMLE